MFYYVMRPPVPSCNYTWK